MKKILLFVAMTTTMALLWANVTYASNDASCYTEDLTTEKSFDYDTPTDFADFTSNSSSCASSCNMLNSSNDCGNIVYEGDEFPGSSHHSTMGGNGSGTGCQHHGYSSPYTLSAGSNSSYTLCTEYTASSTEAAYITYVNTSSSSCVDRGISLYKANTCSVPSGLDLDQPTTSLPGRARGLTVGESYVVCHSYGNGCSSSSDLRIYEVCMIISEAVYCSSSANPQPVETCSGEDFQININSCTVDSDLGVSGGTPGYAAFLYSTDNGNTYTNFPTGSTAGDINGNIYYKFYDDSNLSNGGGCAPIDMSALVNNDCEPLVIPIGIVSIDVASIGGPFLSILTDCPFEETTVTVYPQFTSQVTGNTIQLIAEDGTVCETYSNSSSSSNYPTALHEILLGGGLNGSVLNSSGNPFNQPRPDRGETLGGVITPGNPGSSSGSATIPSNIPCVTPSGGGLFAVNNNGNTLLEHTVEVNEEGHLVFNYELPVQKAKLYPNPASSQLFFSTGISDTYTVKIYDTLGKQVFAGLTNDDAAIDIQHLSSGLYTYALEDNQQNIFDSGKWVKK